MKGIQHLFHRSAGAVQKTLQSSALNLSITDGMRVKYFYKEKREKKKIAVSVSRISPQKLIHMAPSSMKLAGKIKLASRSTRGGKETTRKVLEKKGDKRERWR